MSDLDDLNDIYETTKRAIGSPCHPHQARVRRAHALTVTARAAAARVFNPGNHKSPVVTLAAVNLPELKPE